VEAEALAKEAAAAVEGVVAEMAVVGVEVAAAVVTEADWGEGTARAEWEAGV